MTPSLLGRMVQIKVVKVKNRVEKESFKQVQVVRQEGNICFVRHPRGKDEMVDISKLFDPNGKPMYQEGQQ